MPRFSSNLTFLFNEYDFLDRFDAAANAGFRAVEYMGPYDHAPDIVAARLARNGLTQALFNMPAGDLTKGERGMACIPGREQEFRASVDVAITYAKALGCEQVNCLSGLAPAGADRAVLEERLVENLKFAADRLERAGVRLVIEAINPFDMPGFFLNTSKQAFAIMDRVGSTNLRFQYDIYHMQRMEGELAATIEANLARIGHMQVADNPGRHEPGTGEINVPFLMEHLDRIGYAGWVGAEYRPSTTTEASLGWFDALRSSGTAR